MTLYFVETDVILSSRGSRIFEISVNDKTVNEFDFYGTSGSNPMSFTFKSILPIDEIIKIGLQKSIGDPMLSAVLIADENYRVLEGSLVTLNSTNVGGDSMDGFQMENDFLFDNTTELHSVEGDINNVFSTGRRSTNATSLSFQIKTDEQDDAKFTLELLFKETKMWHQRDRVMELKINGKSQGIVDVLQYNDQNDELSRHFMISAPTVAAFSLNSYPSKMFLF